MCSFTETRKLQNEELHGVYSSPYVIRVIDKCDMGVAMGKADAGRAWLNQPEEKKPVGRPRLRWEDIKMGIGEIGWEGIDWIRLAWDKDKWWVLLKVLVNPQLP